MPELRIVAGEWKGRRIKVPPAGVRPTSDRVREAWMSIVLPALDGARVADLCAGSGALGLEALSRGAAHCDFVEKDPKVAKVLKENIAALAAGDRATVHSMDAEAYVQSPSFVRPPSSLLEIAFADPPYASDLAARLAALWLREPFATIFGVEHSASLTLPDPGAGRTADRRLYGDTALTLYRTGT